MIIISKDFTFEASHVLPKHQGKCSQLHGHSWKLNVAVSGSVNERSGFVVDYGVLKACVEEHIISRIDHTHLGYGAAQHYPSSERVVTSIPYFGSDFYPSSENLVKAIGLILSPYIEEMGADTHLYAVSLNETCTSQAIWRPDNA